MTDDIERYADLSPEDLLSQLGQTEPPFDPFAIAESLGVTVKRNVDFRDDSASGEISVSGGERKVIEIWVDPLDVENRQRFTMAHEVAHLIKDILPNLDSYTGTIVDTPTTLRRDGSADPREYAANRFAARLLMPKKAIISEGKKVIREYQGLNGDVPIPRAEFVARMRELFRVSEMAMEIRLKTLGIVK